MFRSSCSRVSEKIWLQRLAHPTSTQKLHNDNKLLPLDLEVTEFYRVHHSASVDATRGSHEGCRRCGHEEAYPKENPLRTDTVTVADWLSPIVEQPLKHALDSQQVIKVDMAVDTVLAFCYVFNEM